MSLSRNGWQNTSIFTNMDNLVYTYETNSNKLKKVLDNGNDNYGFKDGVNLTEEYVYDANGNLVKDLNKGIGTSTVNGIIYNHLNLPTEVKFNNSNTKKINFTYNAEGVKVRKVVNDNGSITTTDYAGNYIYENNVLKQFNHPEGYVMKDGTGFKYVYNYLDHLGSVRLAYSDFDGNGSINPSSEILQERNTYPFGLEHKGYNNIVNGVENNYKTFLGQELNKELGLNWLTFRHRNYMPDIGRFFGVDPISEEYFTISTYQFAHNNPIWKIEIEGLEGKSINKPDEINKEPIKRTVTVVGQPTFRQDNRTPEQRKADHEKGARLYKERQRLKNLGPPSQRVGAERSLFIMQGVAYGMADFATGQIIGKLFKGATLLKSALKTTSKVDNTVVVIGEGMGRVKNAQSALIENGVKNVEVFSPSKAALKEWGKLTKGGVHLSDDAVKGTKLFKENKVWIKKVNESGKTILDIGNDGRKKTSTFYKMEQNTVYGSQ